MAIDTTTGIPLAHVATILSSGTWLVPKSTSKVFVSIHGASGGAGGNASGAGNSGGAGGPGIVASGWVSVAPGGYCQLIIGAGGGGGASGTYNGRYGAFTAGYGGGAGTTAFDGAIIAYGGGGGNAGGTTAFTGGAGGATSYTSLTTVNPGASTIPRVTNYTTTYTGGFAGGVAPGGGGSAGLIHIYA